MTRPGPKRFTYRSYCSCCCCLRGKQQPPGECEANAGVPSQPAASRAVGRPHPPPHQLPCVPAVLPAQIPRLCSLSSPNVALLSIQFTMRPCTAMGTWRGGAGMQGSCSSLAGQACGGFALRSYPQCPGLTSQVDACLQHAHAITSACSSSTTNTCRRASGVLW